MITLRQIRSFIAVYEEGSFTRAASRESATQSGVSQHIQQIEKYLEAVMFVRGPKGISPTGAGERYYKACVECLNQLETAAREARASSTALSGDLTIGISTALARGGLAPTLSRFQDAHPDVGVRVIEAYSGVLTEMVKATELDFAVVPSFEGALGLEVVPLLHDHENMVSSARFRHDHLTPVKLSSLEPLKVVLPGPQNTRRQKLDVYFATNGVQIDRMLELDAMIGTLDFVAQSDWVCFLPSAMLGNDYAGNIHTINPLIDPPLGSEFVMIEPARKPLSVQAKIFAEILKEETAGIIRRWREAMNKVAAAA